MAEWAFIWDLDGTLLDSYEVIVSSLQDTFQEFGLAVSKEILLRGAIQGSVSALISDAQAHTGIPFDRIKIRYSQISGERKLRITRMPHGKEILELLSRAGAENFVFTHRGATTKAVLDHLELTDCFREVVTSLNGFPRKPAGDAVKYLMEKYELDPNKTFYVGDRSIDMECAKNAGVRGVLYLPPESVGQPTGAEDCIVRDLLEIRNLIVSG